MNQAFQKPEDFYSTYALHRTYVRAETRKKHVREFGRNIWTPGRFAANMRVLEIGCGTGLFLAFLSAMGVRDFLGVEMDPKVKDYMPPEIAAKVMTARLEALFDGSVSLEKFDRIVLLDVFEHFSPAEGVALLRQLEGLLKPGGRIVLRVPNMASPWGLQFQYNDFTHKACYAPGNIRQLALAAGMECETVRPYSRGSAWRRLAEGLITAVLDRCLADPPPVWTANFLAFIRPAGKEGA
jgi:2-polyprenyl-3-methyl-5-hydroxy-6-metoxy-1,4-benzoquinol methylase